MSFSQLVDYMKDGNIDALRSSNFDSDIHDNEGRRLLHMAVNIDSLAMCLFLLEDKKSM